MAWPNMGQAAASTQVASQPRLQVAKRQTNVTRGRERKFLGGGGMAVGPLRKPNGTPLHPQAARAALVKGMQG